MPRAASQTIVIFLSLNAEQDTALALPEVQAKWRTEVRQVVSEFKKPLRLSCEFLTLGGLAAPMPRQRWGWGWWALLALSGVTVTGVLIYMRRIPLPPVLARWGLLSRGSTILSDSRLRALPASPPSTKLSGPTRANTVLLRTCVDILLRATNAAYPGPRLHPHVPLHSLLQACLPPPERGMKR